MINADNLLILIVDIQEKLLKMLAEDKISDKAVKLLQAAEILGIPAVITEQYPKGLGKTPEKIRDQFRPGMVIFEKTSFGAMGEKGFRELIAGFKKAKILICGIETHVCVYQTAAELIQEGYKVEVIKDITASRSEFEFNTGLEKMKQLGIKVTSLEIALFELLRTSKHPKFKEIQGLIKDRD